MNEEQAFQQAMLENPNDLALRMVFADWLEERGDPRGELLRLTHTLTQSIDVPQRAEFEARVQSLVDRGVQAVGPFWTNSIGMRFAWIPPGTFVMGSPKSEQDPIRAKYGDRVGEEVSREIQHPVILTQGFFLGVHQVTQADWQEVMGANPSHFWKNQLPVETVSWVNAIVFCNTLSQMDGKNPYYNNRENTVTILGGNGYRLATEAQWEYACRAGAVTAYGFGDTIDRLFKYAWCRGNSSEKTRKVGRKKPSAWGLHDMHGNVFEWCWDWYGDYPVEQATDPSGPSEGQYRVLRGGSWYSFPLHIRSAYRGWSEPARSGYDIGVRVCFCPE